VGLGKVAGVGVEEKRLISEIVNRVLKSIDVSSIGIRSLNLKPFEVLVAVILSQKTNRENVRKALESFRKEFKSVEEVASARVSRIGRAIRPAGLWRMKAPRIKLIAKQVSELENGLDEILRLPYPDAKKALSSMKGIGPKTADVFLMIARDEQVLPIDTHIFRVMRRLGIAGEREDYESLRMKLESAVEPEMRMTAHLALIEFGREICKARNPKCGECPLAELCPSRAKA